MYQDEPRRRTADQQRCQPSSPAWDPYELHSMRWKTQLPVAQSASVEAEALYKSPFDSIRFDSSERIPDIRLD